MSRIICRLWVRIGALGVFGMLGAVALAPTAQAQLPGIHVQGYGSLRVDPDTASFTFGIEGQTDSAANAMQRADAVSGDLVRRLERLGIASEDIRSTPVTLNPFVDRQTQRELVMFNRTTTAILRDLDQFEAVNAAALAAGVNSIGNVNFTASNMVELQTQARDLALNDARRQAEEIAAVMNVRLGRLLSLSASRPRPQEMIQSRNIAFAVAADAAPPDFRSGSIEIVADAQASYEIIQP
jgi:uncharacterized protein YggE